MRSKDEKWREDLIITIKEKGNKITALLSKHYD